MRLTQLSRRAFIRGALATASAAVIGETRAGAEATQPSSTKSNRGGKSIRFGATSSISPPYENIATTWRLIEELGFDTSFVFDHFMPPSDKPGSDCCFDSWSLLPALATQTKRLRIGVLVTCNTFRHPAVLAKMATTLDHVSGGRVILGMGAGWMGREHTTFGIPFDTAGGRARRLVESVEVIKLLFTQEKSTFDGKYYSLDDAPFDPKPLQKPHIPILIGGKGPKVIQPLVARHAQIWHFGVPGNDPAKLKAINDHFDDVCAGVGRDPAEIERATSILTPRLAKQSNQQIQDEIHKLVEHGFSHFILTPGDAKILRRFAEEVIPSFRA